MRSIALLPVADGDAESEPFVVEEGQSASLLFRSGPGCAPGASILIEARTSPLDPDNNEEDEEDPSTWNWEAWGTITNTVGDKLKGLALPGTYRLNRAPGVYAGVDQINAANE